jgi:protein-L-isoaspartate(D-aspartate) O-methyltransferase
MAVGPEEQRRRLVAGEAARGIRDPRVLEALGSVRREEFVTAHRRAAAYDDRALPIEAGQTISQPYVVALMTEALELAAGERVLEVGTGSGYQAAVLRCLGVEVVTIERIASLADSARDRLARLGYDGIEVVVGDGTLGWPALGPYDAIVVTAGGPEVPPALLEQLAPGGRLVMPVGGRGGQRLVRVRRGPDGTLAREDLGWVAFVPLVGEQGWPTERAGWRGVP